MKLFCIENHHPIGIQKIQSKTNPASVGFMLEILTILDKNGIKRI